MFTQEEVVASPLMTTIFEKKVRKNAKILRFVFCIVKFFVSLPAELCSTHNNFKLNVCNSRDCRSAVQG